MLDFLTGFAARSSRSFNYDAWGLEELPNSDAVSVSVSSEASVWVLVSLVLAVVGGILGYCLFVKKSAKTSSKFLTWLKNFLNFDAMVIEDIAKIAYMVIALFITLSSFAFISESFLGFLVVLIVGNLILRVGFESVMMMISIWRNTTEIKKSVAKEDNKKTANKK